MKGLSWRLIFIVILFIASLVYVVPWSTYGINLPVSTKEYKLGLDLNGGVELDYKVDFDALKASGKKYNEGNVIEGLKSIIEKRVNSLGTAEPTIETASYGGDAHIIVQIPTQRYDREGLSPAEQKAKNDDYIQRAKDTIGKVVRLEFREKKDTVTDQDRADRRAIADHAYAELSSSGALAFGTIGTKYHDQYENVEYTSASGAVKDLPPEVSFTGIADVKTPYLSAVMPSKKSMSLSMGADNKLQMLPGDAGYTIVYIKDIHTEDRPVANTGSTAGTGAAAGTGTTSTGTHMEKTTIVTYESLFVNEKPSIWAAAKTSDGRILNEQYLLDATVGFSSFQPQIDLHFNTEGAAMMKEITTRLLNKQLAIFVGGQMVTDPTVRAVIPDGQAVITGSYTADSAKQLTNDINTGIVPAPIYLTSERSIDAKIGADALAVIVKAGFIGLLFIIVFLVAIYRVSGLLAGVALILYGLILVAIVRLFGIVLTLASIAGVILSIGLAIDANILIFERVKEELRNKSQNTKALVIGFTRSWSAIWDSHVTSLSSAVILYIFGISLIKGFGLMLGIGIILSLFTAMFVSRVLIFLVGTSRAMSKNNHLFLGLKDEE